MYDRGRGAFRRVDTRRWEPAGSPISARGAAFLDYWQEKCPPAGSADRFPRREDIRPEEIVSLLPYIFMLDVLRGEGTPDFRFRLVGTAIVNIEGELTGKLMSELFPDRESYAVMWQQYVDATEGRIWVRHETLRWQNREHVNYEVILAPLAGAEGSVETLLGIAHAQDG